MWVLMNQHSGITRYFLTWSNCFKRAFFSLYFRLRRYEESYLDACLIVKRFEGYTTVGR